MTQGNGLQNRNTVSLNLTRTSQIKPLILLKYQRFLVYLHVKLNDIMHIDNQVFILLMALALFSIARLTKNINSISGIYVTIFLIFAGYVFLGIAIYNIVIEKC